MRLRSLVVPFTTLVACVSDAPTPPGGPMVPVTIATDDVAAEVHPRFFSFAVDMSQVVGGDWWADITGTGTETDPYDFRRPALKKLVREPWQRRSRSSAPTRTARRTAPAPSPSSR